MPQILIPLHPGFEEIEAITPADFLRRAGFSVTLASTEPDLVVEGKHGIRIHADQRLADIPLQPWDALVLPGGPGIRALRGDPAILQRIRIQAAAEQWIAAICAAPLLLKDARILPGTPFTAHFPTRVELPAARPAPVVISGRLITSDGAGTAPVFALAIITTLASREDASAVAASVCLAEH